MNLRSTRQRGNVVWKVVAGVVVAAIIAAGGYWWLQQNTANRPAGPAEAITLAGALPYPGSSLIQLAQEKGIWADEGLVVTIQPHTTGKNALEMVVAGKADLATTADLPVVFAVLKGAPVTVIATMATSVTGYGVVARKGRGISVAADLKGKRIGVTMGTSGHFWFDGFLVRQHLSSGDVKLLNVAAENLAATLAAGNIDAVATWEPFLGAASDALGDRALTLRAEGFYDSPWNLVGLREFASRRPEAIKRFLRALLRAERLYAEQPDVALALIAKARATDLATTRRQLSDYRFNLRLGQSLLGTLEDESRWAMRNKLTAAEKVPNFLDHIYTQGLQSVNPDAVTIIR